MRAFVPLGLTAEAGKAGNLTAWTLGLGRCVL